MNILQRRKVRVRHVARCIALGIYVSAGCSMAEGVLRERSIASMSPLERSEIEIQLDDKINAALRGQTFFPGQSSPIVAKSRLDKETNELLVDIGEENGPHAESLEMEDLQKHITEEVFEVLGGAKDWAGVDLRFGGKDMYFWFPDQLPVAEAVQATMATEDSSPPSPETVVLSAGHGVYYHKGYQKWTPQRDPSFSVLEDDITQDFVAELNRQMVADNRRLISKTMPVVLARSLSSDIHEESGRPWRDLAGRYHIKSLYPDVPAIWHSRPHNKGADNERIEDMYSRPALANHVNAAASIHIHTNAWKPETRGARFFYQKDKPESKRLASSLACHVREVLQASYGFADYVVEPVARSGNYAELRSAKMPSSLIEIGFHTNEKDAAAMSNPTFRMLAMAGVRKGYELFKAGVECDPFKVTEVTRVSTFGPEVSLEVAYSGTPTFPVYLTLDDEFGNRTFAEATSASAPNRLQFQIQCSKRKAQTKFFAYLEDGDYVLSRMPLTADCWVWMPMRAGPVLPFG